MRLVALIALLASPALAQSPQEALFPFDGHCYLRYYKAAHLAQHPAQQVQEIALGPYPGFAMGADPRIKVAITLRSGNRYDATAYCENDGAVLSCQLEGDGGWFHLHPRPKGALMFEVGRRGIALEGADFLEISGTRGDDREFLMPHVPADSCP